MRVSLACLSSLSLSLPLSSWLLLSEWQQDKGEGVCSSQSCVNNNGAWAYSNKQTNKPTRQKKRSWIPLPTLVNFLLSSLIKWKSRCYRASHLPFSSFLLAWISSCCYYILSNCSIQQLETYLRYFPKRRFPVTRLTRSLICLFSTGQALFRYAGKFTS